MAGKLIANLIVIGSTYLARGLIEGYRKALANAKHSGVAHETLQNVRNASKAMTEQEARQILGASVSPLGRMFCRNTIRYLKTMPKLGASIFSRKFTGPRKV